MDQVNEMRAQDAQHYREESGVEQVEIRVGYCVEWCSATNALISESLGQHGMTGEDLPNTWAAQLPY